MKVYIVLLKELTKSNLPTHYFPDFYGDFLGPYSEGKSTEDDFQLIYRAQDYHVSLVTLVFTADSVSFVDNRFFTLAHSPLVYVCMFVFNQNHRRSRGRIVEAIVDDFMALVGFGYMTVTVQNIGLVTSDYAV